MFSFFCKFPIKKSLKDKLWKVAVTIQNTTLCVKQEFMLSFKAVFLCRPKYEDIGSDCMLKYGVKLPKKTASNQQEAKSSLLVFCVIYTILGFMLWLHSMSGPAGSGFHYKFTQH